MVSVICHKSKEIKDCCGGLAELFTGIEIKSDANSTFIKAPYGVTFNEDKVIFSNASKSFEVKVSETIYPSIDAILNIVKDCDCCSDVDESEFIDEGELVRMESNPNNPYGVTEDGFALRYHRDQFPELYGTIGAYATDLSINIPGFSTEPNSGPLGVASFASGFNTTASGDFSSATGFKTKATGNFSSANGNSTQANGYGSFSYGTNTEANGDGSFAGGTGSKANGRNSFSVGENNEANGNVSVSLGANNKSNGQASFTSGDSNEANGINATATGLNNIANGDNSTSSGQFNITDGRISSSFGDHLVSNSYAEVSLGSYNEIFTPINASGFNPDDVALGIGVGLNESSRKNALTIFKNGIQRWLKSTLSSVIDLVQGDHAVDQNGVLNRYDGTYWIPYSQGGRTIYHEEYFASSVDGTTQSGNRNLTITRNSTGFWTATLNTSHPDGINYHPTFTAEEQANFRDGMDIHVVQGTKTANGFDFMITAGDNGARADGYVDTPFTLSINAPITI